MMRFSRLLMTITAVVQFVMAVACMFLPQELLAGLGMAGEELLELAVQLIGATYLAMAMLNWMTKQQLLGGIYGKPVLVLNFTNFTVASITLFKALEPGEIFFLPILTLSIVFAILSAGFGHLMFTTPKEVSKASF